MRLRRLCRLSPNAVATTLLIPIAARKPLDNLSDEIAMKLTTLYYADPREALLKALAE